MADLRGKSIDVSVRRVECGNSPHLELEALGSVSRVPLTPEQDDALLNAMLDRWLITAEPGAQFHPEE